MVLAKRATEIAAKASHRQDTGSRMKEIQRFLLDGIQCDGGKCSVIGTGKDTVLDFSGTAQSKASFFSFTMMMTDFTSCHGFYLLSDGSPDVIFIPTLISRNIRTAPL